MPGDVLLVHTSFRAVRPVEGGPEGLVAALREAIGAAGTLVMPSWTGEDDAVFDPLATRASPDLGIVADTFWRLPGVRRSGHPFAFAAAGPDAELILRDPLPLPPHIPESPVGRVHELDGKVLLLGVDHEVDTTLHLAELLAGVPYRVPKEIAAFVSPRWASARHLQPTAFDDRPDGIARDRWDVAIETASGTILVECGAVRERVSQELARRIFDAVKADVETRC